MKGVAPGGVLKLVVNVLKGCVHNACSMSVRFEGNARARKGAVVRNQRDTGMPQAAPCGDARARSEPVAVSTHAYGTGSAREWCDEGGRNANVAGTV